MAASGYAGKVGWTVGRADWLDNPASMVNRYWRKIEYGQSFEGLILIGLWGDRAGTNERPNPLRTGSTLARPGGGGGDQKFVPFGVTNSPESALRRARFALWYYITDGQMGKPSAQQLAKFGHDPKDNRRVFFWLMSRTTSYEQIPFVSAHAAVPLEGRHFYTKALASFDPMQVQIDMLRAEIGPHIRGHFTQTKARAVIQNNDGPRTGRVSAESDLRDITRRLGGVGAGVVTVSARREIQDLVRTGKGQFPQGQWQAMLIDINRKVARAFQEHVVSLMQNSPHKRPETHDLIIATMDDRNRYPV